MGKLIQVHCFGESHGEAVGAVIEGLPSGFAPDPDRIRRFLARRAGRPDGLTTSRTEADEPRILSGLYRGYTTGTPLTVLFENRQGRGEDYAFLPDCPRPGHADYPAFIRNGGFEDPRGGGCHSGRLTLPLAFAGGLAIQLLEKNGVGIGAHLLRCGAAEDEPLSPMNPCMEALSACADRPIPAMNPEAASVMEKEIRTAAAEGTSLGGVVECVAVGLPAGLGGDGEERLDARLSSALFAIPAVKGVEIGDGFDAALMRGSEFNDAWRIREGRVETETNHTGGVLGGITTGMPLLFRAAFRPTPSITLPQRTVNLREMKDTVLNVGGRHDPCCALRAVPVVEAAAALVLLDCLLVAGRKTDAEK